MARFHSFFKLLSNISIYMYKCSLYILDIPYQVVICRYLLSFNRQSFCFVWWFPSLCKSFLVRYNLIYFCFCCLCLRRQIQKILLRLTSGNLLHLFFPRSFIVLGLTCKSLIHLEFIFGRSNGQGGTHSQGQNLLGNSRENCRWSHTSSAQSRSRPLTVPLALIL